MSSFFKKDLRQFSINSGQNKLNILRNLFYDVTKNKHSEQKINCYIAQLIRIENFLSKKRSINWNLVYTKYYIKRN